MLFMLERFSGHCVFFFRSAEGRAEGSLGGSSASVDPGSAMSEITHGADVQSEVQIHSTLGIPLRTLTAELCSIQGCLGRSDRAWFPVCSFGFLSLVNAI